MKQTDLLGLIILLLLLLGQGLDLSLGLRVLNLKRERAQWVLALAWNLDRLPLALVDGLELSLASSLTDLEVPRRI